MAKEFFAEVTIKGSPGLTGKVLHVQEFPAQPGQPWYWVILPSYHPTVGYWFLEQNLIVDSGELPKLGFEPIKKCKLQKDGTTFYLTIGRTTIDLLRVNGYVIMLDDRKN